MDETIRKDVRLVVSAHKEESGIYGVVEKFEVYEKNTNGGGWLVGRLRNSETKE